MTARTASPAPSTSRALVSGAAALTVAQAVANGGNYVVNLVLGRWLDPVDFADTSMLVAVMLLVSVLSLGLQLTTARAVAGSARGTDTTGLKRFALGAGLVLGALLAVGSPALKNFLHAGSVWPFVVLAAAMPWYLSLSVGRGVLQGRMAFVPLAAGYVVEMLVRVGLSVGLVWAGYGVLGAATGLTVSVVATWVSVRLACSRLPHADGDRPGADLARYGAQVGILLAGQIVANNADVLIAKHSLPPDQAARYAAVSLVGRAVFFLTWSVAVTLYPVAARSARDGGDADGVLGRGALAVLGLGTACVAAAAAVGGPVLEVVLGAHYAGLSLPLAGYALATTGLSLANLVASHQLAGGRTTMSWVVLAAAVGQTGLLMTPGLGMTGLIGVQIVGMSLLAAVTWLGRGYRPGGARGPAQQTRTGTP